MWLLVGLGLLAAAGPLAQTAGAHATLVSSTPGNDEVIAEAPTRVVLTFDDGVAVDDGGVRVLNPEGTNVAEGAPTTSKGGLEVSQKIVSDAQGTYTVSYRALSGDGHVIDGSYVFHVGHRTGSAKVETTATFGPLRMLNAFGRWISLTGALLLGGVLAMALFVDGPRVARATAAAGGGALGSGDGADAGDPAASDGNAAVDSGDPPASDSAAADAVEGADSAGLGGSGRLEPRPAENWATELASARFILLPAAVALLFGVGLSLLASAADLAGGSFLDGPSNTGRFVTATWPGAVAGLRVFVALVLVIAVMGAGAIRKVPWLSAICILGALVLPSFGGHAWTASPKWVAVGSDALHILSAAAWVGALGVLVLSWDSTRERVMSFSRMALVAAPVVVLTGLINAGLQERSVSGLTDSAHGRMVIAKAVGAAIMVVFGFVHRRRLADAARWTGRALNSYRAEAAVGVAVLAVTAVLVGTVPGREARPATEPVQQIRQAGDTTVRMQIDPAAAGPNDIHLYYLARDGSLSAVDAAELKVSTSGVAPRAVPVTPITANHGAATGVQLTKGTWTIDVTIVSGGVPSKVTFTVPIA